MRKLPASRPSPAMAVAFIALLAALSGTAIALPGTNTVDSGDIKNGQVKTKDIKNNNVSSGDVRNSTLTGGDVKDNSLTGTDINESALAQVPSAHSANTANTANSANSATSANSANRANSAASVDSLQHYAKVASATPGASFDAAREAAPEIALAQRGAFAIYGKCFQGSGSTVWSITYIRTSVDGSVLDSDNDDYFGDPFLDVGTSENDREIHVTNSFGAGTAFYYASHTAEWQALAPGGSLVVGSAGNGVKEGDLPGGNGVYGAGDACLFTGFLSG